MALYNWEMKEMRQITILKRGKISISIKPNNFSSSWTLSPLIQQPILLFFMRNQRTASRMSVGIKMIKCT